MNNEIFKLYPFNKIERWIVNSSTKTLVKRLHPENSNYDEDYNPIDLNNGQYDVVTLFYPFFSKEEKVGDEVIDSILHNVPRTTKYRDYAIEECFMNEDGTFAPYIAVGSFLASELNGVLKSLPLSTPVSGKKISDLLAYENVIDEKVVKMIKKLSKFVLQSTNSQLVLGDGLTSSLVKEDTGSTMELGNTTGNSNGHVSLFGLEDFYGNLRTLCKGLELKEDGLFSNGEIKDGNPLLSDGYISKTKTGDSLIPSEVLGDSTTHYTDWYETQSNWININSKTSGVLTVKDGEIKSKGLSIEGKDTVLNLGNGKFKNEEVLSGVVKSEDVYVGRMQNGTPEWEYGQFQINELENIGEVTSISTVGESQVFQHENGTVIVEDAILNNSDVTNLPDPRVSMMFGAGPEGLEYWNSDYDKMPIKTINMAGLQKWEETDDYIIYLDKDAIVTTVQNYVPGTFDLFNERKSQIEAHAEMLKMYEVEWTPEDSEKLLLDINNEQLERIASTPTTMDEPTEIQTFSARAVPTTYECCFRTDKKTGEIYIGEGYENLFVKNINYAGQSDITCSFNSKNNTAIINYGKTTAGNKLFELYKKPENIPNYLACFFANATGGKVSFRNYSVTPSELSSQVKLGFNNFKVENDSNWRNFTFVNDGTPPDTIVEYSYIQITKTSTPKPFVKSVMPAGKLAFVTDATEETHTFVSDLVPSEFYGVCFTETDGNSTTAEFKVERLGQAVGKGFTSKVVGLDDLGGEITEIQSDFDNCYPWSEMKRVIVDNDLNIVSRFGDANYDPTLSSNGFAPHTHTVMRFTPECYVKRIVLDLSEPYGEKWQQTIICVSKHPLGGYEKHDAFLSVNADGTISENKGSLINAYEATCVNKLTGIPVFADVNDQTVRNENDFQLGKNGLTNYSDYFLTSYDARNKQAPTSSATMSNARIMTESRNTEKKITGLTYHAHELDMCLFAVEFASLNGQKILGDGISSVNDTPNTANNSATVGYTSALGNKSGSVQIVDLMRGNNIPVSTQRAISYRGRENPFGNIWKYLEGTKTGTSGKVKFGIYNPHTSNNYADYNANSFVKQVETEQVFMGNSNGYWRVFGHRKSLFIPSAIKNGSIYHGSSSGCRVGDYVWYHTDGGKIAMVGGIWNYAGNCGFGCSHWYFAFTSLVRNVGFGLSAHCKEVS